MEDLEADMEYILSSPGEEGILRLIVTRPNVDERQVLEEAEMNTETGLEGDSWKTRAEIKAENTGEFSTVNQINVMNARAAEAVAGEIRHWKLAGDQLYVDFDISTRNLPAGSLLAIGSAVLRISEKPHTGCGKFKSRFGSDALKFVNSEEGRKNRLRGLNASVFKGGRIRTGDKVFKLKAEL